MKSRMIVLGGTLFLVLQPQLTLAGITDSPCSVTHFYGYQDQAKALQEKIQGLDVERDEAQIKQLEIEMYDALIKYKSCQLSSSRRMATASTVSAAQKPIFYNKLRQLEEEVHALKGKKGEALSRAQELEKAQEVSELEAQLSDQEIAREENQFVTSFSNAKKKDQCSPRILAKFEQSIENGETQILIAKSQAIFHDHNSQEKANQKLALKLLEKQQNLLLEGQKGCQLKMTLIKAGKAGQKKETAQQQLLNHESNSLRGEIANLVKKDKKLDQEIASLKKKIEKNARAQSTPVQFVSQNQTKPLWRRALGVFKRGSQSDIEGSATAESAK